jgi:hypothetical protein
VSLDAASRYLSVFHLLSHHGHWELEEQTPSALTNNRNDAGRPHLPTRGLGPACVSVVSWRGTALRKQNGHGHHPRPDCEVHLHYRDMLSSYVHYMIPYSWLFVKSRSALVEYGAPLSLPKVHLVSLSPPATGAALVPLALRNVGVSANLSSVIYSRNGRLRRAVSPLCARLMAGC